MNKNKIEITGDMDLGAYSPLELSESQEINNSSKLTMSKLSKMIAESIQTHLVDVLGKYTEGKASSEQANKAIMDLANSSNGKVTNESKSEKYVLYADTSLSGNSDFISYTNDGIEKGDIKYVLRYLPEESITDDGDTVSYDDIQKKGDICLEKDGYVVVWKSDNKQDIYVYKKKEKLSERNNRGFSEYAGEYEEKHGEKLPDDVLKSAAEKNDDRFHGRQVRDGKYSYVPQGKDYNSKMGRLNETVDKDMEERIRKTVRQMLKSGELPDGKDSYLGNEMAEWYDKILKKALDQDVDEVGGDLNVMTSVIDDEFGKRGGNYDLKNEPNHKKSVDNLLKKIVNESLEDEMLVWKQRDNSEFGQTLKQLERIAEDGLIDAGSIISHLRTEYALDGNMQATTRSVIHCLREYDFICVDEDGNNINIEFSNSPEAAQLCIKLKELSQQQSLNESYAQEGNYTHFAVNKTTNKIVNGWDYSDHDADELRMYKRDYFTNDLVDYGLDPRQYTIITRVGCKKRGINPDDDSQWENGQVVNEGDGNDPYYGERRDMEDPKIENMGNMKWGKSLK